jgi:SNF2 family DNA or RNA helicase
MSTVIKEIVGRKNSGKAKLVFCLFRKEMEHLKRELWFNGIGCAIINGSTTKKQRKLALQAKMNEETREIMFKRLKNSHEHILNIIDSYLQPEVLIAQIQTCCEGLNLQHFAEVYFTTPHWNPAVEDQAIARAHRIGQDKEVEVFRFVTTFTNPLPETRSISLDQYCIEIQKKKRECATECGL